MKLDKKKLSLIAKFIDEFSNGDGLHDSLISRIHFFKMSQPNDKLPVIYRPSIYLVVQGSKKVTIADETITYDTGNFLSVSVDLPIIGQVTEATHQHPYLCIQIDLEPNEIRDLALQLNVNQAELQSTEKGLFVGTSNNELLDILLRLLGLLQSPNDIEFLAPLFLKEFYYRLVTGPYGHAIMKSYLAGNNMERIAKAISFIKSDIARPRTVEQLAAIANMSTSGFHHQFKRVTTLSPIQYVKRLRLTQARQLMLTGSIGVTTASQTVGYESPSQFSRDYSKLFNISPKKDMMRLKKQDTT